MSRTPPTEPPRNDKPIPKEAMKFLKLSPSVKVMALKKSTTSCRVRPSQGGLTNNPLAGSSGRCSESGIDQVPMRMKQLQKDRKMISVLSVKSGEVARKQFLERSDSGVGERQNSWRGVEKVNKRSGPNQKPKHWYGGWIDTLLSRVK